MWIAKFSFESKNSVYGSVAKNNNVILYGHTISSYEKNGKIMCTCAGAMIGGDENKKNFINELRKQSRVVSVDRNEDFLIVLTEEQKTRNMGVFYDKRIIHVRPIIIDNLGFEHWEIASWERNSIQKLIDIAKNNSSFKLYYFKKGEVSNLYITSTIPQLSPAQKEAMDIALKHNYYDFPRKTSLREMAKKMNISLATYREHLRRAEKKVFGHIIDGYRRFDPESEIKK